MQNVDAFLLGRRTYETQADQALSWLDHAVTVRGWVDYVYFTRHYRFLESLRPTAASRS
jgi:hypothetical protein